MGAGIYTYRVEDGRDLSPPLNRVVFIVTKPNGEEIKTPWEDLGVARAFCNAKNKEIMGR